MRDSPEFELLDALLRDVRLKAAFVVLGFMGPGRAVDLTGEGTIAIHYVQGGDCSITIGEQTFELRDGEMLVMPKGLSRTVGVGNFENSSPFAEFLPRVHADRIMTFSCGCPEGRIQVLGLSGCVDVLDVAAELLPVACVLPTSAALRQHLGALIAQVDADAPGAGALAVRLAEVVFIHAIRDVLVQRPEGTALAIASSDPHLARSLLAVRSDMARAWTVPQLAKAAGLSRSAFADLFSRTIGMAPMRFVRQWRMEEAKRRLREGEQVQVVANAVGYASAAAFSTAYKEVTGHAPSVREGGTA